MVVWYFLVPFLNLFSLLQTIILSKVCYAKISLIFQSDFSFLCERNWQFWWESAFFSPQRKRSKQLPAPQNDHVQFGPFPVIHCVGFFVCLFHKQLGAENMIWREEFCWCQHRAVFWLGSGSYTLLRSGLLLSLWEPQPYDFITT